MIPSDILAEINNYGFDNVNYPDARLYKLLTRANRKICAMGPFSFTQKFSTWTEAVATPGTPLGALSPQDIRAVNALGCPAQGDYAGNITYLDRNLISKIYGYNSYLLADFPRHYNVYGKNTTGGCNLYVYPYITAPTIFALDYCALPPVLSAGSTEAQMLLPDAYSDIVMNMVLAELANSDGDLDDGAVYLNKAKAGTADLLNDFDVNNDSPPPMLFTDEGSGWFG